MMGIVKDSVMNSISKYILISFLGLIMSGALVSGPSFGQEVDGVTFVNRPYEDISYSVRVINSTTLVSGKTRISLWGIEKIRSGASIFHLKVRGALEKEIGAQNVLCTIKDRDDEHNIKAQCINGKEEDLSLFLLQQGYASADRTAIYGSIYERPYLDAEEYARQNGQGAWAVESLHGDAQSKNFMMAAFFLMTVFILALSFLGFHIMRGFGRVVDIQNQSIDLASKERVLKDQEKFIVASIIDAEIKANKSKIEAYIMVYEEVLQRLDDDNIAPKYQKTGEIIQKQPALDRSVFDGNTHKLDSFGSRLASSVIHYYARIKTVPDYVEITPDMPKNEVIQIIAAVVDSAKKMDEISDKIRGDFVQHALIKRLEV